MKMLFLDDSYQRSRNYLGYGGFVLPETQIRLLASGLLSLKADLKIPRWVDLKWSPGPRHFLRAKFAGSRHELYGRALGLLRQHGAQVVCAVHDLNGCYGVKRHGWSFERSRLWATKQQLRFLTERFESPCLSAPAQAGLIIADHYSNVEGENSLIREAAIELERGTNYRSFEMVCLPPLTATPRDCSPLQLADIAVGVTVASLAGNKYGLDLFEHVAVLFLRDPHERAISFSSLLSSAVLGFGLKLFPPDFRPRGAELFRSLDRKYKYTADGLSVRDMP